MSVPIEQPTIVNKGQFQPGSERAKAAGRKGGALSSGNFKHNRERAVSAGRKGGQAGQKEK